MRDCSGTGGDCGIMHAGELTSLVVLLAESAPRPIKGQASSLVSLGTQLGLGSATLVAALLRAVCTPQQMLVWGWRIPFFLAAIPGGVSLYYAQNVEESEEFLEATRNSSNGYGQDGPRADKTELRGRFKFDFSRFKFWVKTRLGSVCGGIAWGLRAGDKFICGGGGRGGGSLEPPKLGVGGCWGKGAPVTEQY